MPISDQHARLDFHPHIYVTAEHAADVLGISLQHADELLSSPDTKDIVQKALSDGLHEALDVIIRQLVRSRWPKDGVPLRIDCTALLPSPPISSFRGNYRTFPLP